MLNSYSLSRSILCLAALGGAALSCYKAPQQTSTTQLSSALQGNFTFAPPEGTNFERTEQRSFEYSLVGTPLTRREEQELRWQVAVDKSNDGYRVKQVLTHVILKRNGETLVDSDVPKDAIRGELIIDNAGNLKDVRGLDSTAQTLHSMVKPNKSFDAAEERAMATELKAVVARRYEMLTGNIVGHPAELGTTWTVSSQKPGVISTTATVENVEGCDGTACARVRQDAKLDPAIIRGHAEDLIKRRVKDMGGKPEHITVKTATYSMTGSVKVEPSTMLNHEAILNESGTFDAMAKEHPFQVTVTGKTQYSYKYGKPTPPQT
jgi:hypothetical protein